MDSEAKQKHIEAGKIAKQALQYGAKLIKVGASLLEVSDKTEEKIRELGGSIAFPAQISRNHIAAHYCATPEDKTMFQQGDVVKIDIGVHVGGYVADTAVTVDLGNNKKLLEASRAALEQALKLVKSGVAVSEIGRVIQETIQGFGFSPIRNLSGHGVGKFVVHQRPSIPNYDTRDKSVLEEGMVIAIEPFATTGEGVVYEQGDAEIFMLTGRKPVRNRITRNIMKEIETFQGLPFTTRWLCKNNSPAKVNFALREIDQLGILHKFPPLPDKGKGLVSQHEHTVIVLDKPIVITQ